MATVLAVATTTFQGVRWRAEAPNTAPRTTREAYSERGSRMRQWKEPCEEMFEFLAERSPGALLRMISEGQLTPPQLTFAAEHLGRAVPSDAVVSVLESLLGHSLGYVREGAVYGLAQQRLPRALELLRRVSTEDEDPAVREAATDSLAG
jgi:hypothetical protein